MEGNRETAVVHPDLVVLWMMQSSSQFLSIYWLS